MRTLLQRVAHATVIVDEQVVGAIGHGFLILLGIGQDDSEAQVQTLVEKIVHLRVFGDDEGKMNCSLLDIGGEALVVSQFTLYADVRRLPSQLYQCRPTSTRGTSGRTFRGTPSPSII